MVDEVCVWVMWELCWFWAITNDGHCTVCTGHVMVCGLMACDHDWFDEDNVGVYKCVKCGKTGHIVED